MATALPLPEEQNPDSFGPSVKPTVSQVLNKLAEDQVPNEEQTQKCQEIALKVFMVLQEEFSTSFPGHVMVAGSFGKGTALASGSDYDIVIFFNDLKPPFIDILERLENSLKVNAAKLPDFKWKFRSTIHVCFDVDGIQIDVTPAAQLDTNFCWDKWCFFDASDVTHFPSVQYVKALEEIKNLPKPILNSYIYSSSLSIEAVVFVQRQTQFIRSVIRLGKFWGKQVNTGRLQIRGKSLVMETLAIHACYAFRPTEMVEENLDKVFLTFLVYVADFSQLRLFFLVNYAKEDIPESLLLETPLMLDPANPFNNLLSPTNFSPLARKCFEEAAKKTIVSIREWEQGNRSDVSALRRIISKPFDKEM